MRRAASAQLEEARVSSGAELDQVNAELERRRGEIEQMAEADRGARRRARS